MTTIDVSKKVDDIIGSLVSVKLTIRKWGATSVANDAAREIETQKKAKIGRVGAYVSYLPEDVVHGLGCIDSRIASSFKLRSLPFEDGGWRVVMADGFMPLADLVASMKPERDEFVEKNIIAKRDVLEADARRDLGELFKEFPSTDDLRGRYSVDFSSRCLHAADDVRVKGLSEAAVAMVRESQNAETTEKLRVAISGITGSLRTLIEDMAVRLGKDTQKRTRYGGLADNVKEVCGCLTALNITGDPALTKLIVDTQKKLTMFSPDALREGGWAKNVMKANVDSLLRDLDNFGVRL